MLDFSEENVSNCDGYGCESNPYLTERKSANAMPPEPEVLALKMHTYGEYNERWRDVRYWV